jgi:glycosyltransferase involved in cell wall biosynthesis
VQVIATGLPLDWTARSEAELDDAAAKLEELCVQSGADLAHLNAPAHAGLVGWRAPLVVVAHSCVATWWRATHGGPLPADLAWRAQRTRLGMALADSVIVPSHSFARQLADAYGHKNGICVVYNGSEAPPTRPIKERDCILTAGRLWDPAKGARCIDEAAALIGRTVNAAGPTRSPNGEQAEFAHLVPLGSLEMKELASLYRRTAIFISMSRYEPFGLSVLEAARAGAALVLSDIETFRELWHGAACFVPFDDASALASAVDWLSRNELIRTDLAGRARARSARYSVERNVDGTLRAYRRARTARSERAAPRSAA